jgi:solute carrier family 25 aspartate/glutamate transporter 12/13
MATASGVPVASKVKETVKETLLGSEEPAQLSAQTKATFMKHAHHDEAAGELVMTELEFVDAIAPEKEDYVSLHRTLDTRRGKLN